MNADDENACWVGFDLGGTKMLSSVFDSQFRPLGSKRKKTRGQDGVVAGLERMAQIIRRTLDEAGVEPGRVRGIGVGCPGPLDLDRGVILEAPNLGWNDAPVRQTLEREFGCPAVILNDVDAGVYGEYRFGAGRDAHCVVGIFPGTGVGGGCIYEGKILRGRTGSCMEIGHVRIMPDGPLDSAGHAGTLESVSSRLAISAAAAQAAYRGQAPHLMRLAGTDLSDIRSGVLAASIAAGDRVVERIVRTAARHIGQAAANLVHLLAPDVVVLGGGLVEAMPQIFREEAEATARAAVLPSYRDLFRVAVAELGDDATVKGAAAYARELVLAGDAPSIPVATRGQVG